MRGSLPSFTAAIAPARKSIARRISPCESRSAWSASRSVCSAVTENESGTCPSVWTTNRWRRWAERSRMNCVKSRPDSDSDCTVEQRRLRVAVRQRLAGREHQLGVGHAEDLEHVVELHLVAAVGDELLERPERVAERCRWPRARASRPRDRESRCPPRAATRRSTPAICSSEGRWKSKRWQRSMIVAGTLCASVVASTNTTCAGGSSSVFRNAFQAAVREHVRLVEDVHALAALHRRERHVLAQLADVVDRVVRRRVHLDHVERGAGHDRPRRGRLGVEIGVRARPRRSGRRPAASPSTSSLYRASRRTDRRGAPCPARSRCGAS